MISRDGTAHSVAKCASRVSPYWRLRLWARLTGGDRYRNEDASTFDWHKVGSHNYEIEFHRTGWNCYAINSGYYYQDEVIAVLRRFLKPGHCFVDVGANIGFLTLTAARLVGKSGKVVGVEPNPDLVNASTPSSSGTVVSAAVGGIPEVTPNSFSEWLVPPGDSQALASAVIHALRNPTLRYDLGRAGE